MMKRYANKEKKAVNHIIYEEVDKEDAKTPKTKKNS
jgi:hypothetical protein